MSLELDITGLALGISKLYLKSLVIKDNLSVLSYHKYKNVLKKTILSAALFTIGYYNVLD